MEARKALAQQQKELSKAQARMTELDTLFRKLYEDNALGRLTDERFVFPNPTYYVDDGYTGTNFAGVR